MAQVLSRGAAALPGCLLLRFALADAEESQGQIDKATAVYESLLNDLEDKAAAPAAQAGASGAGEEAAAAAAAGTSGAAAMGLTAEQAGLAWVQYMRFARRSLSAVRTACSKLDFQARYQLIMLACNGEQARLAWRICDLIVAASAQCNEQRTS